MMSGSLFCRNGVRFIQVSSSFLLFRTRIARVISAYTATHVNEQLRNYMINIANQLTPANTAFHYFQLYGNFVPAYCQSSEQCKHSAARCRSFFLILLSFLTCLSIISALFQDTHDSSLPSLLNSISPSTDSYILGFFGHLFMFPIGVNYKQVAVVFWCNK